MVFPLCWSFNYIRVGKACIYGALTECEPVQLQCLQANAQSHKAVPLGPFHSSTRLLMTAMCLPWREGPSARHWHRSGHSNWGRVVCVKFATNTGFQRKSGGVWERKHQADSRCHLCKCRGPVAFEPTCWRGICSPGRSAQLPKLTVRAFSATWGCSSGKPKGWNAKGSPWRDSAGSACLAGLSDQTCHTCLGHWCRCSRSALTVVINRWQLTV